MLEDILERSGESSAHLVSGDGGIRLKSLQIGQLFGAGREFRDPAQGNWRTRMNKLLDALAELDVGLLITVDEVRGTLGEMVQLAAVYQHFIRENRKVALLMAGLPEHVSQLIDNESVSFLRRADRRNLERLSDAEVADAFERTVIAGGRTIDPRALTSCTQASEGFPYMMQLVGFRTWAQNPETLRITEDDARCGIVLANDELDEKVLASTWHSLSTDDKSFLAALACLDSPATLAQISSMLGRKSTCTTKCEARLLDAGVIQCDEDRRISFALPRMREYVMGACR